jgi:hypothetical protein
MGEYLTAAAIENGSALFTAPGVPGISGLGSGNPD